MSRVVATHAVGDMNTWLGGGEIRSATFAKFSSSHRIFRHVDKNLVSIVWEDVDLEKMRETLGSSEATESKAKHTVIDPIDLFIEVPGGT